MKPMSDENQALQKEWCDSASAAIKKGAIGAVNETAEFLRGVGIEVGPVLEIGPQWGFGLEAWSQFTDQAVGLEVVPEFHAACVSKGLTCSLGSAEDLDTNEEVDGTFNLYMRDTLEHFVDRDRAWANILDRLHEWIYISVPIEPGEPRDKAHFGKFSSVKEAQDLFDGMILVKETIREPMELTKFVSPAPVGSTGRYTGIWKKETP